MKVILLKDIPKLGRKFDVKNVSDGYGANMLIPRGMAILATESAVAKINSEKSKMAEEEKIQEELLHKNIDSLKSVVLKMTGRANEKGHLFAGITKNDIMAEIEKNFRFKIDSDFLKMDKPIKETGSHKIKIETPKRKIEMEVLIETI